MLELEQSEHNHQRMNATPCPQRQNTDTFAHRPFYTQTLLHTDTFTHRPCYTQSLSHTEAITHRRFYTQKLLHTEAFTHRSFYTQTLPHTEAFTHRSFYTQTPLHTQTILHTDAFIKLCLSLQSCTIHCKAFVLWLPNWEHHSWVWHGKEPLSQRPANWRLNASTKN